MRTITMSQVKSKNCETFSKKNNSVRGYETVSKSELKLGDKIILDNYFTEIVQEDN